jgi:hypothetical protein
MSSLLWSETPDDERVEADDTRAHGDVDETFAARRLRRWIKGMFGGRSRGDAAAERTSGEGAGEPRGSPDSGL